MEYLTSLYFDDKWTQGAVAFILHWNNQVRTYNELKPRDTISDSDKMSLLQKSIKGVDDLHRVYTTAAMFHYSYHCVYLPVYYSLK